MGLLEMRAAEYRHILAPIRNTHRQRINGRDNQSLMYPEHRKQLPSTTRFPHNGRFDVIASSSGAGMFGDLFFDPPARTPAEGTPTPDSGGNNGNKFPPGGEVNSDGEGEPRIRIVQWDATGPTTDDNIASFTIIDPDINGTRNMYCIGYEFLGGDMTNTENWTYDHTAYWDNDNYPEDEVMAQFLIPRVMLDNVLAYHHITVEELLIQYCKKLEERERGL